MAFQFLPFLGKALMTGGKIAGTAAMNTIGNNIGNSLVAPPGGGMGGLGPQAMMQPQPVNPGAAMGALTGSMLPFLFSQAQKPIPLIPKGEKPSKRRFGDDFPYNLQEAMYYGGGI